VRDLRFPSAESGTCLVSGADRRLRRGEGTDPSIALDREV
jgi:hypothetical protein